MQVWAISLPLDYEVWGKTLLLQKLAQNIGNFWITNVPWMLASTHQLWHMLHVPPVKRWHPFHDEPDIGPGIMATLYMLLWVAFTYNYNGNWFQNVISFYVSSDAVGELDLRGVLPFDESILNIRPLWPHWLDRLHGPLTATEII